MDKVKIIRSIKRTTLSIQIMPDMSITVSVPYFFPSSKIKSILKDKELWIKQKQAELKARIEAQTKKETTNEKEFLYLGKKYPLKMRQKQKTLIEFDDDTFYFAILNHRNIALYLTSWYKQQALKIIKQRVNHYSHLSGLKYNTLSITNAETRWGSCSSEKNLHFNWRLIMAPLPVIDYVVAHELAHLEEMNHSRQFWEKVRKMFPIYRQYNTWLKRNGHTLRI